MTPADPQQRRLLERLRQAGDQPVAFAELHASGIALPAAVVTGHTLSVAPPMRTASPATPSGRAS